VSSSQSIVASIGSTWGGFTGRTFGF
jgi:hypothetical protein